MKSKFPKINLMNQTNGCTLSISRHRLHLLDELCFQSSVFRANSARQFTTHQTIDSARSCLWISPFLVRRFAPDVIHSAMSNSFVPPEFRNCITLMDLLVVFSIHLCPLRAFGSLWDARQSNQAVWTRINSPSANPMTIFTICAFVI